MHGRAARWVGCPAALATALESLPLAAAAAVGRRPSQAALLCAAKCNVTTSLHESQTVGLDSGRGKSASSGPQKCLPGLPGKRAICHAGRAPGIGLSDGAMGATFMLCALAALALGPASGLRADSCKALLLTTPPCSSACKSVWNHDTPDMTFKGFKSFSATPAELGSHRERNISDEDNPGSRVHDKPRQAFREAT